MRPEQGDGCGSETSENLLGHLDDFFRFLYQVSDHLRTVMDRSFMPRRHGWPGLGFRWRHVGDAVDEKVFKIIDVFYNCMGNVCKFISV